MPRAASTFVCSECGHASGRWEGRCGGCGEWNTLVEEVRGPAVRGRGAAGRRGQAVRPVPLGEVQAGELPRLSTGLGELDAVLGGGLVPGSLVLIGGAPGIGKSTLTTMALANLLRAGRRTLYVSAEESAAQVRLRAERLSSPGALRIPVIAETDLHAVLGTLEEERPEVCVIDSVQTLHSSELTSAAGSVAQVREVAGEVMRVAKQLDIAVLLVGHVTKEGSLAGPRVLEHLVDCVLQFEGERERTYRTLRAIKNRFGSTNEAGVFEMRDDGLVEVLDASARFVGEATRAPGSVVLCAMEGSRPLLVEVQALVSPSELVPPRRVVSGLERNRVALVLAVLARHGGIGLGSADVFVNVVGGVRVEEPGSDLAVALAVSSAARGVALGDDRGP
ncbi:MAG: DNA repair protein RadA, partial [Solirubrobacterales bacterium]|nr:DNA repair protein RadA [Solirubrobacterales bacterium]